MLFLYLIMFFDCIKAAQKYNFWFDYDRTILRFFRPFLPKVVLSTFFIDQNNGIYQNILYFCTKITCYFYHIYSVMTSNSHVIVENIDQFNRYFHQPTYHPLVSVADLSEADLSLFDPTDFGMYCVVLMEVDFGELVLRNTSMHYRGGTIFTMKPGDVVSMHLNGVRPRGRMLVFRPELLNGTGLGRDFYMFNFFDYEVGEALELYEREHNVAINSFNNISAELQAADDEFTSHMLRLGIGQLLTSCRRFYERQFDTRKMHISEVMLRLDSLLDGYLSGESDLPRLLGQPNVAWCASQFHLSPNYFGDLVRREINMTAQAYIQQKVIEKAKLLLADPSLSINDIAARLGFSYANHFTRFFRNKEGISPTELRNRKLFK